MTTSPALPSPLVEAGWLESHLGDADLRILDCTVVMKPTPDGGYTFIGGYDEWLAGHIPGAVFCDVLGKLADRSNPIPMMVPPPAEFAAVMSALGVGAGTRVVLYDRSNHAWAARVWWMLRYFGFDAVAVLNGGWTKWTKEQRPVSRDLGSNLAAVFEARPRPELIANKNEVLKAIGDAGVRIINALSPEEFSGAKSRFPRAGRIAGSANVYCQSLIDPATGAYLPADELRRRFEESGALKAGRVITYCGAGIAASSDALALKAIGVADVAVYDGSLSEWTADPALPMETG